MKKRKYLYRLALVMLLGLILPAVLVLNIFWRYALRGWEETNQDFYGKALFTYTSLLDNKIKELETFAAQISADSREYNSILLGGGEAVTENAYQLYMAVRELQEKYVRRDVSEWGIYFYDADRIITSSYSYDPDIFIYKYTGQNRETAVCADFFSEDNYAILNTLFDSTNTEENNTGCLLVGICTRIGENNEKALVFFVLSPQDINSSLAIAGGEGIAYYLMDQEKERVLLMWGDIPEEDASEILSSEEWKYTLGMRQRVLYDINTSYQKIDIKAYVSQDSLQTNIIKWVNDTKLLLFGTVILLLFTCSIALYISYKPMYELTSEFEDYGEDEFDMIRHKLVDQGSRIDEQQMLILDLLLNHLIYGVPISEERIKQLGIGESMRYYCVFLIEGYTFINSEMEKLTTEIEQNHNARIFMTDWNGENCSVVIAFLKNEDITGLREKLEQWLKESYAGECFLYTGTVYDRLENIQLSLRSCLEQMKKRNGRKQKARLDMNTLTPKQEQQKKMLEDILAYLEIHFRDANLSQIQVADMFRISNYTLSRLFKNQVGVGFAEYLTAKRLEYAKEQLLTTSYSVRDVSIMSGFTSENYFSRVFKLYEGVSPSAFRNQ